MASLVKKRIRGRTYYYARESQRVNGKPKIVWQKYLGRAQDIIDAMTSAARPPPAPQQALISDFAALAALYDLAQRLRIPETIDRHAPKTGRGPGVGTYLLVATLNRCVAPCSKARIGEWFEATVLRRLLPIETRQLTSQRFWDNMDRVSHQAIGAIERDLAGHLVREFDLDLRHLLFDATNFFTFIDSFNTRNTVAQRGKSKQGRAALRIVGLALLVSADFHVPLLHRTYPGNQHDAPTFASLTDELVARYRQITDGAEHVTLVFDKGNNSKDNLQAVEQSPYHFVGSLVPTQHPELLRIPSRRFHSLEDEGLPGVRVHRTRRKVFGVERTVLVTYNDNLFVAQSQTLLREIAKRQQQLRELQQQLRRRRTGALRGGRPPTIAATKKKVDGWLEARHMRDLFQVEIGEEGGLPSLSYRFDQRAWTRLQRELLGKSLLFTDNDEWTDAETVRAYRSQHHVESAFRTMKDPLHISLRPQHHWTDQKIEVHVFTCVLALMLCSLLRRELAQAGIDRSIAHILDELSQIREVGVLFSAKKRQQEPTLRMTLSAMTEEQQRLYDTLYLARYRAS
jgi:transposase